MTAPAPLRCLKPFNSLPKKPGEQSLKQLGEKFEVKIIGAEDCATCLELSAAV